MPRQPSEAAPEPDIAARIVAAARRAFLRGGYRHTSMESIAREAGLAKATLYLHFPGKEAIFRRMIDNCRAAIVQRAIAAEAKAAPLPERIADLLYAYGGTALEWFGESERLSELAALTVTDPDAFGPIASSSQEEEEKRMAALLEAAQDSGEAEFSHLGGPHKVAVILIDAACGAKRTAGITPVLFQERLAGIALLAQHAARAPRG